MTLAFSTLTLARLFHGFNCRGIESIFRLGLTTNRASLGAFAAGPEELHGLSVLLVDDIFTTGATFSECARVLREQGASHVYGAALAQTPRRPERNKQRTS